MVELLHFLEGWFSPLRVLHYITVRALAGAGTAFLLCVCLGPWAIRQLRRLKVGQYERPEVTGMAANKKAGTPTMGGLLIILAVAVSALLWCRLDNALVWLALATLLFMGCVGFWDDYLKLKGRNTRGLSGRKKLLLELVWALAVAALLLALPETRERARQLLVPFLKDPVIRDMGALGAFAFLALVVVGASNAVNLTDGLDGLAIGCSASAALSYMIMAYVAGHLAIAHYLIIPYVRGAGELAVFSGCLLGACLGFLWWNCHPAAVFMGDTGSLALGGSIAMVAVLIKQELALLLVGGIFVIEALSVILQVASFKLTGRRLFAMAPIHHHFQMKKWSETQIVIRFWVLSIIFALIGILTLKIR